MQNWPDDVPQRPRPAGSRRGAHGGLRYEPTATRVRVRRDPAFRERARARARLLEAERYFQASTSVILVTGPNFSSVWRRIQAEIA